MFLSIILINKKHTGNLRILAITQDRGTVYRDDVRIDIKTSEASAKSYKIIEEGDFIISLRSFQGGIEYSTLHGICSPTYTILKPTIEICNNFFNIKKSYRMPFFQHLCFFVPF